MVKLHSMIKHEQNDKESRTTQENIKPVQNKPISKKSHNEEK